MSNTSMTIDRYLSRSIQEVQGYLSAEDASIIATLLRYQTSGGVLGNLCEIGVHHGRLFFLLALARGAGEKALAIDLFEDDNINKNTEHAGRDRALFINARRLGIELREEEIFKTSSLDVDAEAILSRTGGQIRFFSVDGSHVYRFVKHDLEIAARTLSADGVIVVDDFFNIDWPDVSFATYDVLLRSGIALPFAVTSSKLYLAAPAAAEKYQVVLRKSPQRRPITQVEMLDRGVLAYKQDLAQKGYEALRRQVARIKWAIRPGPR